MTTDNKTLAVDVRSVWSEMADSIANRRDECLERGQFIQAEIYREMLAKHSRATITLDELIEACNHLKRDATNERWSEFHIALARAKGESA